MHTILVVFVILLAILMLISALGGSLNIQEKYEEEQEQPLAEMFYELPLKTEEQLKSASVPVPVSTTQSAPVPPSTEAFTNSRDIEPFEEEDMKYGSPL